MWRRTSTILRCRVLAAGGSGLRPPFTSLRGPFAGGSGLRRTLYGMCLRHPSLACGSGAASPLSLSCGFYSKGPFEKKNEELTWYKALKLVVNRVLYIRLMKRCKRNTNCRRKMIEFMVASQNVKNYWISIGKCQMFDLLGTYSLSEVCLAFIETYTPTLIYFVLLLAGGLSTLDVGVYNYKVGMYEDLLYSDQSYL